MEADSDARERVDHGIHGVETTHPSFGMIGISRVQGQRTLFGVDFPQGHFIELTIYHGKHVRNVSNDWFHSGKHIIQIAMSETQWARMICSPNQGCGVPCTLEEMFVDGQYVRIQPQEHDTGAQGRIHEGEIRERAQMAMEAIQSARTKLDAVIAKPAANKGDLRAIRDELVTAERNACENLKWVMEQAGEAIDSAKNNAMAEIQAYVEMQLQQLGTTKLAELAAGETKPKQIRA